MVRKILGKMKKKRLTNFLILVLIFGFDVFGISACSNETDKKLLIEIPEHGFVSLLGPKRWEESLVYAGISPYGSTRSGKSYGQDQGVGHRREGR
jgi:hypothetical protein